MKTKRRSQTMKFTSLMVAAALLMSCLSMTALGNITYLVTFEGGLEAGVSLQPLADVVIE